MCWKDRARKEVADVHNEADSICYAVERQVRELGSAVSHGEKSRAEMLVADLRQKLKDGADMDTLKSIMNELRGALVLLQQAARTKGAQEGAPEDWQEGEGEYDYDGYDSGGGGYDNSGGGYSYDDYGEEAGFTASGDDVVDADYRPSDD